MQVGGTDIQVSIAAGLKGTVGEGMQLKVDFPGGDTAGIGLHHNAVEQLIYTPARHEDRGEIAAAAQLLLRTSLADRKSSDRLRLPGW